MHTPTTPAGLARYDAMHPELAALHAWREPGARPDHHRSVQQAVSRLAPDLVRLLVAGQSRAALALWREMPAGHRRRVHAAMPLLGRALDRGVGRR